MTDTLPPPRLPNAPASDQKSRSCWVVGCGGCLGILALFVIISMVVLWQIKRNFMVEPFAPIELTSTEEIQIRQKLEFLNLLDAGGQVTEEFEIPPEGLILSEAEVNYWISRSDNSLADSVRMDFEPNELSAELRVGDPGGKRLMLKATFGLPADGNIDNLRLLDLKLGKFSLPESVMSEIEKENLDVELDPDERAAFESKVDRIEILKDQIRFILKPLETDLP